LHALKILPIQIEKTPGMVLKLRTCLCRQVGNTEQKRGMRSLQPNGMIFYTIPCGDILLDD
jgi:hypothetical protein